MPRQRDIYTAPFPFSDEDTEKLRPVLIITNSVFNASRGDVIVMAVTSNLDSPLPGVHIDETSADIGRLPAASRILPHKVYTLSQDRIGKFHCRLKQQPFDDAIDLLKKYLSAL